MLIEVEEEATISNITPATNPFMQNTSVSMNLQQFQPGERSPCLVVSDEVNPLILLFPQLFVHKIDGVPRMVISGVLVCVYLY